MFIHKKGKVVAELAIGQALLLRRLIIEGGKTRFIQVYSKMCGWSSDIEMLGQSLLHALRMAQAYEAGADKKKLAAFDKRMKRVLSRVPLGRGG